MSVTIGIVPGFFEPIDRIPTPLEPAHLVGRDRDPIPRQCPTPEFVRLVADPLVIDRESPLDELYSLEGAGQPGRQFPLVFPPRVDWRAVAFGSQPLPGFQ